MTGLSRRGRRLLQGAGGLAVVATLATSGVAVGTPPTGTVAATTLASVNTLNNVSMDFNQIQLDTIAPVRVLHVSNVADPGYSSGWHFHNGPVIIAVTKGTLTFYDRAHRAGDDDRCTVTVVTAPGGYIETAGEPIQAFNTTPPEVNNGKAAWIATQIIPPGSATRVDLPSGFGCGA